jgi:hypothetical protein
MAEPIAGSPQAQRGKISKDKIFLIGVFSRIFGSIEWPGRKTLRKKVMRE